MNVEDGAYPIDYHPEEPLFQILACQSPQSNERQGIGEGVEDRNRRIGKSNEDIVGAPPCSKESNYHRQIKSVRHVDNRQWLMRLASLLELPYKKTIDGSQGVVTRHAGIAIESVTIVEPHV